MKRNMVPLFGIAFVVAIISTGVFYGLFAGRLRSSTGDIAGRPIVVAARDLERGSVLQRSDLRVSEVRGSLSGSFTRTEELVGAVLLLPVKENEPLIQERVALREAASANPGPTVVPAGMRAVSIRVAESEGVANWLRPGARVDLEAVSERNGVAELKTILQNVEVLGVTPPPDGNGGNRGAVRIVSVLTSPQDADVVALADSAARLRVALRNPLDEDTSLHRPVEIASLFRPNAERAEQAPAVEGPRPAGHPIQLQVQVLAVSAGAESELDARLSPINAGDSMRIATFPSSADPGKLVESLKQRHELEVVSSQSLMAAAGQPASYRAGAGTYHLRMRFSPATARNGTVSLAVTPEISVPSGHGVETRQYDAELPEGASFLVEGLTSEKTEQHVLERLFPGHTWTNRNVVILVTQQSAAQPAVSTLLGRSEGR